MAALRDLVAARGELWFPELTGRRPAVEVMALSQRPSCSMFLVTLRAGSTSRRAVVKVRADARRSAPGDRPTLIPDTLDAAQQTAVEHHALVTIEATVDPDDGRFGVVRALDVVPELCAVVIDYVDLPTLRRCLLAQSRLGCRPRDRRLRAQGDAAWHNAGAWLRRFHGTSASYSLRTRLRSRDDVLSALDEFGRYLSDTVGVAGVTTLVAQAQRRAAEALPAALPLAVGHGDFVARNMFVDMAGRVSVFDPLPRWDVPVYDDICRFLVGLRLVGLQVHTQGLGYPAAAMADREHAFLAGYFGDDKDAVHLVRAYQPLILLDKWAALVSRNARATGVRGAAAAVQRSSTHHYVRREAARVLASAKRS